jgi:hypothetical protein
MTINQLAKAPPRAEQEFMCKYMIARPGRRTGTRATPQSRVEKLKLVLEQKCL